MTNIVKRCGMVLKKLGMTQLFHNGMIVPVTLLRLERNVILDVMQRKGKRGYGALVVGYGINKEHRVNKAIRGMALKIGAMVVPYVKEFLVSSQHLLEVGRELSVEHFKCQQYVDVSSYTKGKGFAGVMKRHNFAGLEATHGVSISHRSHGSTGNRSQPGKVFKGKKMAGRLGYELVTIQNLKIVDINKEFGVFAIAGAIPGYRGTHVFMRDAVKKSSGIWH